MATKQFDVGILMGSPNDWPVMEDAAKALKEFDVSFDARVISAHRAPTLLTEYLEALTQTQTKVIICGAGGAAHLAGVAAGHCTLPVIGVPIASSALNGMDALLATVQMPKGIPVATVAIGGSYNAGLLAIQILAGGDTTLREKLIQHKKNMLEKIKATTLSGLNENHTL